MKPVTEHFVLIKHGRSTRAGVYMVRAEDRRDAMRQLTEAGMWGNAVTSIEFCEPKGVSDKNSIVAILYLPSEDGNLD